jgi:hypothetical protein
MDTFGSDGEGLYVDVSPSERACAQSRTARRRLLLRGDSIYDAPMDGKNES